MVLQPPSLSRLGPPRRGGTISFSAAGLRAIASPRVRRRHDALHRVRHAGAASRSFITSSACSVIATPSSARASTQCGRARVHQRVPRRISWMSFRFRTLRSASSTAKPGDAEPGDASERAFSVMRGPPGERPETGIVRTPPRGRSGGRGQGSATPCSAVQGWRARRGTVRFAGSRPVPPPSPREPSVGGTSGHAPAGCNQPCATAHQADRGARRVGAAGAAKSSHSLVIVRSYSPVTLVL